MKKAMGLALLVVAMSMTTGCGKNKKRASRLEAELARCRSAVMQMESGDLTKEQQTELAALNCNLCKDGGAK